MLVPTFDTLKTPHIIFPRGQKGPTEKNWPDKTTLDISTYDPTTQNIGIICGAEAVPGGYVIDGDYDADDAPLIFGKLIPTDLMWGHGPERPLTHAIVLLDTQLQTREFRDITSGNIAEIRGVTSAGALHHMTMVPPSVHPVTGRPLVPTPGRSGEPTLYETFAYLQRFQIAATATLFTKYLPMRGATHDFRVAFAGYAKSVDWPESLALQALELVCYLRHNDKDGDARTAIESTYRRDGPVTGRAKLEEIFGIRGKAILKRADEYNDISAKSTPKKDVLSKLDLALSAMGISVRLNAFTNRILMNNTPLTGNDRLHLYHRLLREFPKSAVRKEMFFDYLTERAYVSVFHPVKDYLSNLSWDGIPRVGRWLVQAAGAVDDGYTEHVGQSLLLAAVRRIRNPGTKFDEMVILEGEQGIGKSTLCRYLVPHDEWFSDSLSLYDLDPKHIVEKTQGRWILEISELTGFGKRDIETLKSFLSRQVDVARLAYRTDTEDYPRQFVLVGTTNSNEYLLDDTGNRRFLPVRVHSINLNWIRANRDQLWAEAVHKEAQNEPLYVPNELLPEASAAQEDRRMSNPLEDELAIELADYNEIRTMDIMRLLHVLPERQRNMAMIIAPIMKRLGFKVWRDTSDVNNPRGYQRIKPIKGGKRANDFTLPLEE